MLNILAALAQRAKQERDALSAGRLGVGTDPTQGQGVNVGNIPVVSGAARVPLAALHALGLAQEGANTTSKLAAGLAALYVAGAGRAQHALDPSMPDYAPDDAIAAFQQAGSDPLTNILEAERRASYHNKNLVTAFEAGANPLNYVGSVGAAGKAMSAAHPVLGAAMQGAARAGRVVNDAPFVPFRALRAYQVGDEVLPLAKALLTGAEPPPSSAAPLLEKAMAKVRAMRDTPLSAEAADAATARATAAATEPRMVRPAPQAMVPRMVRPAPQNQVPRLVRAAPQTGIPPLPPEVLQREPTFAYGPPTTLQEAAQRLGISQRPSQAPNTPLELLMAAQGTVKPPTPLRTPPTPAGPAAAPTGTLDDFTALIAGPWSSSRYLPPAEAFSKRLNVPVAQAQQWLDDLELSGVVGRLPDGELAFKPASRGIANATPNAAPSALRDLSGLDLTAPADAITPAQERLARLANEGVDQPARTLGTTPDFPSYTDRASGIATLTPDEIDTLVNVAYPTSDAQGNAIAKYGNPADLASRAVERIQTQPGLAERLSGIDDKLARKIALLPEPAGAALPDVSNVNPAGGVTFPQPAKVTPPTPTIEPLPTPATQPSAVELLRRYREQYPTPYTAPEALPTPQARVTAAQAQDELFGGPATPRTGKGLLPGTPLDDSAALRAEFKQGLQDAFNRGNTDEIGAMLDMATDYKYTPAEANRLYEEMANGGEALSSIPQAKELIESGPYFQVFKYFDPKTGDLFMRHATTRKPLTVVENYKTKALTGKLVKSGKYSEVWEIPGSGYDEVAASAQGNVGGYNPRNATDAGDFWRNAREAFRQYRQLSAGKEIPLREVRADIAAGGGGGGGMGLLPYPGGLTGPIGRAVLPATGAGAGAGIGYLTGDNPEDRKANALKGAAIGGALGGGVEWSPELARQVANLSQGTMYSPTMLKRMWDAGIAAQTEAAGSKGVEGTGNLLRAVPGAWRAQMVNTIKQFPQDALTRLVTLWGIARKELGVTGDDIRYWQELVADERATGVSNLNNPVTDKLRRVGMQRLLDPIEFMKVYGTDFVTSEGAQVTTKLSARQSAGMGAAFAVANGLRTLNPLSAALGAVKGRFQPFINGFVHFGNGVQHDAFRYAMAEKTLARDIPQLAQALTDDLAARGVDVSSLVAKHGYFSGADVASVAGAKLGQQWDTLVEETIRNGGDRIAFLAGDFREASKYGLSRDGKHSIEDTVGKVFPFIRWPLHYGPVLAEVAANNPRLAAVAAGLLAAQQEEAKQGGLKAYERLSTPITTETPVLGALARARLGGQSGTVRLNLPGSVLPYTQLLGGVEMPQGDNATGYEKAKAALGAAGMSPNPLIQAGAYVLGQDYQSPGALSRTAGLEALPRLLPGAAGRLEMPGVGTLLDTTRKLLAPATGAHTSEYDPTYRRYAELVLQTTKKPLSDAANQHYLLQDTEAAQALYQQAEREVVLAGAAGNVYSLTSPISATARGAGAQSAQTAKAGLPFDRARIDASTSGTLQELMRATNDRYSQANPAVDTYAVSNPTDAKYTILRQWEASPNAVWLKYNAPSAYTRAKKSLTELLGLTAP